MSEKLQKVLAAVGLGSRREIERWIAEGRIRVNGEVAPLGIRVSPGDRVTVDGKPVSIEPAARTTRVIAYNKPEGEVCSRHDPEGRPTVFDRLPKLKGQRWISVGRLDINTSGLLLFTTDGELANKLMHPSSGVDREYAVRVYGDVDDAMIQRLREGVLLEDGMARFSDIQHYDGSGRNQWFHVTIMEGRNREVRRLWESQGVEVSRLKRVRYGCIVLTSRLAAGSWQELNQKELNDLYDLVGLPRRQREGATPERKRDDQRQQRKAQRLSHRPRGRGGRR